MDEWANEDKSDKRDRRNEVLFIRREADIVARSRCRRHCHRHCRYRINVYLQQSFVSMLMHVIRKNRTSEKWLYCAQKS